MVFDYSTLYKAWKDTVTQSSTEHNRVKFKYYLEDNLLKIQQDIENKTYTPSPFRNKTILYPKRRVAQVPGLRDKVIQHAMYDNGLYDMLTKPLIKETSACLKGRGDSYAIKTLKQSLRRYYGKYGENFYCLKCDIKSYFASIDHKRAYQLIDQYVTDDTFKWLISVFIEQSADGLALGLPQSQALANLFLSALDHFVKEKLHAEFYQRHMDDFAIISNDISFLENCWQEIEKFVNNIGLTMNPKTCICKNKIEFLGFRYFYGANGKIIMRLLPAKRRSKRRELKKKLKQVQNGELSAEKFVQSYGGWRAHALTGNCWSLVRAWDKWLTDELDKLGYRLVIHKRSLKVYEKN